MYSLLQKTLLTVRYSPFHFFVSKRTYKKNDFNHELLLAMCSKTARVQLLTQKNIDLRFAT